MSDESMPPDIEALLSAERARVDPPKRQLELGWKRLEHAAFNSLAGSAVGFWPVGLALVAFGVGVGVGRWLLPPSPAAPASSPQTVVSEPTPAPIVQEPMEALLDAGRQEPETKASPPARRPPKPVESAEDDLLHQEVMLLERARTALLRGWFEEALEGTREHERRFPTGQLAPERSLVRVQALARSGRLNEADAELARFKELYPRSLLLRTAEAELAKTAH